MMNAILVPLDGSDLADRAVPFATALAGRTDRPLLLLRAVSTLGCSTDADAAAVMQEAHQQLDEVAGAIAAGGLTVDTRVVDAPPEVAIVDTAADEDVGLIVLATHGRGGLGRWIYGSTADAVLRTAPTPVLMVPPHSVARWSLDQPAKIVVPLDGSIVAASALQPARELADMLGGSLLLVTFVESSRYASHGEGHVFGMPDLDDERLVEARTQLDGIAAGLRTSSRPVEVRALFGTPFFDVAAIARDEGADAIVIATHGRGGLGRALLGSVATSTVQRSHVPVLLVRPTPAEQQPVATPTTESTSTPDAAGTASGISLNVTEDELAMLIQAVGQRFFTEPVDPRWSEPVRRLLDKLRAARSMTGEPRQTVSGQARSNGAPRVPIDG
jgi:nucleotide-binding universal stress UspA family protein